MLQNFRQGSLQKNEVYELILWEAAWDEGLRADDATIMREIIGCVRKPESRLALSTKTYFLGN